MHKNTCKNCGKTGAPGVLLQKDAFYCSERVCQLEALKFRSNEILEFFGKRQCFFVTNAWRNSSCHTNFDSARAEVCLQEPVNEFGLCKQHANLNCQYVGCDLPAVTTCSYSHCCFGSWNGGARVCWKHGFCKHCEDYVMSI